MHSLEIQIASIEEAPDYNAEPITFTAATLIKAVIVRKGMVSGNDTVDLQFIDGAGNKYVAMITAKLLKTLTDVCNVS